MKIIDTDNHEEVLQYLHDLTSYTIKLEYKIKKAIEYIEKHSNSFSVLDTISNGELIAILKGDSNE